MDAPFPREHSLVLIDDDDHLRSALRFAFETDGYAVRAFPSGEAALMAAPFDAHACFVVDERLPGLSGLQTIARLRAAGVAAPAILITSHPTHALLSAAAKVGVSIVEKPLLGDALARKVEALLGA